MGQRGAELYNKCWVYHRRQGQVMATEAIPTSFLSFVGSWLAKLGLEDKRCLLAVETDGLPYPFSSSVKLYQADGTCLELDTVAKPLERDHPYVRDVRAGRYDLIVVCIAGWCLREGGEEPCPSCGDSSHTVLEHAVLHELVHVACPEYSAHNEWTDNKVRELLERAS